MGLAPGVHGGFSIGGKTETADTVIDELMNGKSGHFLHLEKVRYISAGTAHTLTLMTTLGSTTLSAAASASQAVINLTSDPGSIAANDYVAIDNQGTWTLHKVSSVADLAVTLTANLSAALPSGAKVWFFGAPTDTGHVVLKPTVSTTTEYSSAFAGLISSKRGGPLMLHSTNATAAGTIELAAGAYNEQY